MLRLNDEKTDRIEYTESVRVRDVGYLLSLPFDDWVSKFPLKEGKKWEKKYVCIYKKFLTTLLQKNENTRKYKYGEKGTMTYGRLYVENMGLHSLPHPIRNFLCSGRYTEVDIKNAHASILNQLYIEHGFNAIHLENYVKNRDDVCKEYKFDKYTFNKFLNMDDVKKTNEFLTKIHEEKLYLAPQLLSKYPDIKPKEGSKNPLCSKLSKLMCMYENRILQHIMNDFEDIGFPLYDGFYVSNEEIYDTTIPQINKKCEEFNIKWDIKRVETEVEIPADFVDEDNDVMSYKNRKIEWEKERSMLKSPLCILNVESNRHTYMKYDECLKFYANYKYAVMSEKGRQLRAFFPKWIEDEDRASYEGVRWCPYSIDDPTPYDYFNTFKKFPRNIIPPEEYGESGDETIDKFLNLMKELSGGDEEQDGAIYLFYYVAHMFKLTNIRPDTAVVMKGSNGVGKDFFTKVLGLIMGNSYLYKTANMDNVFGAFNDVIDEKILLQFNEAEAKDSIANQQKLKDYITADKLSINKKFYSLREVDNYIRLFIVSNDAQPVLIENQDRRYFVIKSTNKYRQDTNFFGRLDELTKSKHNLDCLYSYFMKVDLTDFNILEIPKTEAYNNLQVSNIRPIYKYLYLLCKGWFEKKPYIYSKKKDLYITTPTEFKDAFKEYLENQGLKNEYTNTKNIKCILDEMPFCITQRVSIKISGCVNKYTTFNSEKLLKYLESEYFKNRENEDEDEDDGFFSDGDDGTIDTETDED